MSKKMLCFIIALSFIVSIFAPTFALSGDFIPSDYRNGFLLVPQDSDETGLGTSSTFVLSAQTDLTLEDVVNGLSIENEPSPKIQQIEKNKFSIVPARALMENSIYTFKLTVANNPETTWNFQTRAPFSIEGTLPGNQMTNVPLNSGIELYFSHEGFEDAEKYFEITPSVKGKFEVHDKTFVFVPESLSEETLYKVVIKKDLKLSGTERTLDKNFEFSFLTQKKDTSLTPTNTVKGSINYNSNILDVTSKVSPEIPVNYYVNRDVYKNTDFEVKTSIYAYTSFEKFTNDYIVKDAMPSWAYSDSQKRFTSTAGLAKITEFSQSFKSEPQYTPGQPDSIKVPKPLPIGYYLLDSYWEDIHFQTFVQVTNTGIYFTESSTKTLVWLNNMLDKKPMSNSSIRYLDSQESYTTDSNGVAFFDAIVHPNNDYQNKYLVVKSSDGYSSILNCSSYFGNYNNSYWQHIQTDRNLYQPDDTVKVWGFVKNRYSDKNIKTVTLELTGGNYYYHRQSTMPIIKKVLDVNNSFYSCQFDLPNLEQGGYGLAIKNGDETISSTYVNVEKYTKPAYKIDITKDKNAVFPNQEVQFNIKTAFFEGTGVSNLHTDLYFSDWSIGGHTEKSTGITDAKGNLSAKYTPLVDLNSNYQGEQSISLEAKATLPESGEIRTTSDLRVFVNNINVDLDSRITDGKAILTAKVNNITLDRLNNGTAKDYSDYLGTPAANKGVTGKIYKNKWKEIEDGVYYDFINKVTQKQYRYELEKTELTDVYFTTDATGKAVFEFPLAKNKDEYYTATLSCTDNTGRKMSFERYFWEYNPIYDTYIKPSEYVDNSYKLDGGRENYKINDTIDLTFKKGNSVLPDGKYLYLIAQNGIREYIVLDKPNFTRNFKQSDMPNVSIQAINFDTTSTYISATFDAKYDYSERTIKMNAKLDKDAYKPGEEVKIIIDVTDNDGNPVESTINARIVDEALLKLSDQNIDVLSALFESVGSGISLTRTSHTTDSGFYGGIRSTSLEKAYYKSSNMNTAMMDSADLKSVANGSAAPIRQDFKDTAFFGSVGTDESGHGEIKFKLPDNVTSWRVSLDGISQDLHAGSNKVNLKVSLPFFINYSFNSTYLVGDKPVIGVNAYGDGLSEGDLVRFEISDINKPDSNVSVVGKAFERINIPLWALSEGSSELLIRAYTNSGLGDAVKHTFQVVKSYYQVRKNEFYTLKPGLEIKGGTAGNTHLIFADNGRGQFLSQLLGIAYPYGNRVDQKVSAKEAQKLLNEYFKSEDFGFDGTEFDAKDYQKTDGGISLMTYGDSDLKLSARLASYIKDSVDLSKLKQYFYEKLNSKTTGTAAAALLGLATLKEPVLLNLDKYSKLDNLTIEDSLYLAIAYCEFGDISKAQELYDTKLAKTFITHTPYIYIQSEKYKDNAIDLTALCSLLASKLGKKDKESLYKYVIDNDARDIYTGFIKVNYISSTIGTYNETKGSFKYSFNETEKSVDLSKEGMYHLNIPSKLLANLKIQSVQGDVSVVSIFKENIDSLNQLDNNLTVTRHYYHLDGKSLINNSLKQGDVIKVVIDWTVNSKALDGEYEITDYLPSGLKPTEMGYDMSYYFRKIDGQKVKFNVYNSKNWPDTRNFEYYARVISPGTYTAQGTVIQSIKAPTILNTAANQTITIDAGSEEIATPLDSNEIKIKAHDRYVIFDVPPFIHQNRAMVPMRSIFEVLGANVSWDGKTRTVTGTKGNKKIVLTIGNKIAIVNGAQKKFDVAAKIVNNRTMVPTRLISEALGSTVDWNSQTRTVTIK